jgi:CBS domain-containing protein
LEVFQEDVARFPALMGGASMDDSLETLRGGGVPTLDALQLFNGTVYRWNRPCYGVINGKPHLRIECRVLPSGPSVVDEVANAAFWAGSVLGMAAEYGDIRERMQFDEVRANLIAAARRGLEAGFTWLDGASINAPTVVLEHLLPLAERGLASAGVTSGDADTYLEVIRQRVERGATGAWWLRASLNAMRKSGTRAEQMAALTAATARRQQAGLPVHEWTLAGIEEGGGWRYNYQTVEQLMTTELFTLKQDELVDLAALIMDWKHIRQIPVEDEDRGLLGMVTYGAVLRHLVSDPDCANDYSVPVRDVMERCPVTTAPDTTTVEAIRLMREHRVTSLPVIFHGKLVGIITVDDFLPVVERALGESVPPASSPDAMDEAPATTPAPTNVPEASEKANAPQA